MLSAGSGQTILVKAQGPNALTFLKDPIGLAKGIEDSPFGAINDLIVRTNPRRQLIALESPSLCGQQMFNFLSVTTIGKWSVCCYQPGSDEQNCTCESLWLQGSWSNKLLQLIPVLV